MLSKTSPQKMIVGNINFLSYIGNSITDLNTNLYSLTLNKWTIKIFTSFNLITAELVTGELNNSSRNISPHCFSMARTQERVSWILLTLESPVFVLLRFPVVAAFKSSSGIESLTSNIWQPCGYWHETMVCMDLLLMLPEQPHKIAFSFGSVSDLIESKADTYFLFMI